MKRINSIVFTFVLLVIVSITSCSQNSSNSNNSNSTGDYYPTAINNTWTYTDGSSTNAGTILSTNTFNGDTYYYFGTTNASTNAGTPGTVESWIMKDGANYYQRIQVTANNGAYLLETDPYEFAILKDDLSAGDTWTENITAVYHYTPQQVGVPAFPDQTLSFNYEYTFVASGLTKTVEGVTYNDVIQVRMDYNYSGTSTTTETFFAKDVGLIETVQDGVSTSRLTTYTLY